MLTPQIQIVPKHEFPTLSTETTMENNPIHLSYGLGWELYSTGYGPAVFKEGHDGGGVTTLSVSIDLTLACLS
jgi:hypothetical protein